MLFLGYKNIISGEKHNGFRANKVGKNNFTIAAYKYICELAMYSKNTLCLCFTIYCWNLVARGETVGHMLFENISWGEDSIIIKIPKQKNDQQGEFADIPKHIYCNPFNFLVDPFFGLGLFILCRGCYTSKVFSDECNIEEKYCGWLRSALIDLTEVEQNTVFGAISSMFGSHSNRKGAVTYLCNQIVGGTSIISIFMRAGWSISKQHNPYFHQGDGGDQYCGRVVAGLNVLSYDFATLPPRFAGLSGPTCDDYNIMITGYDSYPTSFKTVIPYLVASVIHHLSNSDNVRKIPNDHPIFKTLLWSNGYVQKYKDNIVTGKFNCSITNMTATGIPTHLTSSKLLEDALTVKMEACKDEIINSVDKLGIKLDDMKEAVDELCGRNVNTSVISNINLSSVIATNFSNEIKTMVQNEFSTFESNIITHIDNKCSISTVLAEPMIG